MEEYRTLNPISMRSMRIGYLIMFLVAAVVAAGCFIEHDIVEGVIYGTYVAGAIAIIILVFAIVFPRIYFDHYRYFISEDRVDVRAGIFFIRHTVVPIERIHQVEVVEGPINRMFGLADVQITTAGGTSQIEYLERDEAERIAEELNVVVDRIVRGQRE